MTAPQRPDGSGLELLAGRRKHQKRLGKVLVEVLERIDDDGTSHTEGFAIRWLEPALDDDLPEWKVSTLVRLLRTDALQAARFRQLIPEGSAYFDEQHYDALVENPSPEQQAIIRDRELKSLAAFDDAYRTVHRKPRVTDEMLRTALDAYAAGGGGTAGVRAVMDKLGRSERTAFRLLAQARERFE